MIAPTKLPLSYRILGIESSCDDSGVAIVTSEGEILSNIVISQKNQHEAFQGVVPEIAARAHMQNLKYAVTEGLSKAGVPLNEIDAIAATSGPGLIGGVIVGCMVGKALASSLNKPFIAINHLEGHALTARLSNKVSYPFLLLLASGGHCQFVQVTGLKQYKILGETLDDAVGEAFDKVAKMMNLGFPGGPEIERLAKLGRGNKYHLPRPLLGKAGCDMSFSGLKTAVRLLIGSFTELNNEIKADIAASFQSTVQEVLSSKLQAAIEAYSSANPTFAKEVHSNTKTIVLAGGVAANQAIRSSLQEVAARNGFSFVAPPPALCTDNAAMIAWAGIERLQAGLTSGLDFSPKARWSLESLNE
jgi:N6-L-threonylcarbamoyladenine synthase